MCFKNPISLYLIYRYNNLQSISNNESFLKSSFKVYLNIEKLVLSLLSL